MHIAVWSGPRNISTALMYSFASRKDVYAIDEPFYAHYLAQTGLLHPMRDDILASQSQDSAAIIEDICAQRTDGRHIYHKHMTHHMLPSIPLDWLSRVKNVFLIRHPSQVIASFAKKHQNPKLSDLGYERQVELFDHILASGTTPIVIDGHDLQSDPEPVLKRLCSALELAFSNDMLTWASGGKSCDGIWAKHWYGSVHASTGFRAPSQASVALSPELQALEAQAMPFYSYMNTYCLK